jgi:hypothetical protein
MAIRNEFIHRNAQATRFGNMDLAPSACTLASRLLQNSPLKAACQIGCLQQSGVDALISQHHATESVSLCTRIKS